MIKAANGRLIARSMAVIATFPTPTLVAKIKLFRGTTVVALFPIAASDMNFSPLSR
jgi:hypothetical protein